MLPKPWRNLPSVMDSTSAALPSVYSRQAMVWTMPLPSAGAGEEKPL
jgi:hypothetical protein